MIHMVQLRQLASGYKSQGSKCLMSSEQLYYNPKLYCEYYNIIQGSPSPPKLAGMTPKVPESGSLSALHGTTGEHCLMDTSPSMGKSVMHKNKRTQLQGFLKVNLDDGQSLSFCLKLERGETKLMEQCSAVHVGRAVFNYCLQKCFNLVCKAI